jgi:hypothetical protein
MSDPARLTQSVRPANFVRYANKRANEPPPLAFVSEISAADRVVVSMRVAQLRLSLDPRQQSLLRVTAQPTAMIAL